MVVLSNTLEAPTLPKKFLKNPSPLSAIFQHPCYRSSYNSHDDRSCRRRLFRVASGESTFNRTSLVFNYFGSLCDGEVLRDNSNFYCKLCCEQVINKFTLIFFVKLDFEIAVDQQTKAHDRTIEGVPDIMCPLVNSGQPRPYLVNFWLNFAKSS